jgi:hypothetical protein
MLLVEELRDQRQLNEELAGSLSEVLSLLALLVQKYKY